MSERMVFINVGGLGGTAQVFADAIHEVSNFSGSVDSTGWPLGDFAALLLQGEALAYGVGTYRLGHNGVASPPVFVGVASTTTSYAHDTAADLTTALITFSGELNNPSINFAQTQRTQTAAVGTGLTGLRFMRPTQDPTVAHDFTELFSRQFLAMLAPFDGLRMLDLSLPNGDSAAAAWLSSTADIGPTSPLDRYLMPVADRRSPLEPIQNSAKAKGVAFEYLIELANPDPRGIKPGQHLYYNMEDWASDEYIQFCFQAMEWGTNGITAYTGPPGAVTAANPRPQPAGGPEFPSLAAGLRFYIEPSNEPWNSDSSFHQGGRYNRLAQKEVVIDGDSDLNWDNLPNTPDNVAIWGRRRFGRLAKRISDIGRATLGDAAFGTRFFPVLMGQHGVTSKVQGEADYIEHKVGRDNVKTVITHIGCGGYRGQNTKNYADNGLTVDQVIGSGIEPEAEPALHLALCATYGVLFGSYEYGWNFGEAAVSDLTKAVKLDPRAGRLTRRQTDDFFWGAPSDGPVHPNSALVNFLAAYSDTLGSWAHALASLDLTGPGAVKYRNLLAARTAWKANPTDGRSTDPMPPLARITGVTIDPITVPIVPGGMITVNGHVLGTNAPISALIYTPNLGSMVGNVATIPAAKNTIQVMVIRARAEGDATVFQDVTLLIPPDATAAPAVPNASFETPSLPLGNNHSFQQGAAVVGGSWTFTGGAGISINGSDISSSNVGTTFGNQVGLIQNNGSLSQMVAGFVAGDYTLTIRAAQRTTNGPNRFALTVLIDGVAVGTISPTDSTYRPYSVPFTVATAGTHTLGFAATNTTGLDLTIFFDDVELTLAGAVIIQPVIPFAGAGYFLTICYSGASA